MKKLQCKRKISTIALILMLTMMALMLVVPAVQALDIPTYLRINAAPNPVGVTQTAFISAFINIPPPTANGYFGDRYADLTIEIVKPDGSKDTLGPYMSDPSGGIYTTFTPTTIGDYTIQAFYPGQTLTGYNPSYPASPGRNLDLVGSEMLPSESEKVTLVVQQEAISRYQTPPLPTEYWSRPIYALNFEWARVLGGNWLGLGGAGGGGFAVAGYYDATGNFQPYTTAPTTGHILWTKPTAFGGQVGGPIEPTQDSLYHSTEPLTSYMEPIIINGILFYDSYSSHSIYKNAWVAVDLHTGETLWEKPCGITGNEWLRYGQVFKWHSMHVFGSNAYLWSLEGTSMRDTRPVPGGNMTLRLYDAMSGTYICEIVNAENLNMISDTEANEQGTLLGWYVSDGNLIMWNSTRALAYPTGYDPESGPARAFRPQGTIDWSAGIEWSIPLPTTLEGNPINLDVSEMGGITPEVILVRDAPEMATYGTMSAGYQITAGYEARTGQLLWGPLNQTTQQFHYSEVLAARDGVYIIIDKTTMEAYGYSLEDGSLLWGPVALPGNAWSFLSYGVEIAYDTAYIFDFGGFVNALDLETGKIKWTFSRGSTGYDSPLGISPLWSFAGSICDGILFLGEGNLYNPPVHPNARMLAINCTSGELVWSILGYTPRHVSAHADGMMVRWNSYDKQIYTFGKGPTETKVEALPAAITLGKSVIIRGTIMDISPGTEEYALTARFPNGVPAVSDADMSEWMEYVYMQQVRPNVTGVKVKLEAVDPNNNYQELGTVTSDSYGNYGFNFEPEVTGEYMIIATFEGSESYYGSTITTYLAVGPAPTSGETDLTPLEDSVSMVEEGISNLTTYILVILALVIIAIVIAVYSMLKSRK